MLLVANLSKFPNANRRALPELRKAAKILRLLFENQPHPIPSKNALELRISVLRIELNELLRRVRDAFQSVCF